MKTRHTAVLSLVVTLVIGLPLAADWPASESRPRCGLPHQGRRAAALEGDGDRELPHRRLRPAPHRLAQHQGSRRLGAEDDEGVGPRQRPPRDLAVRPRLAEPAVRRQGGDAARLSAHRLSEGVDARHQRAGHRRGGDRRDQRREGFRRRSRASCAASSCCRRRCATCPRISKRRATATPTPSSPISRSRPAGRRPRRTGQRRPIRSSIGSRTQFWIDEGVAAVLDFSRGDGGTVFVQAPQGVSRDPKGPAQPPQVTLRVEHYGRILRTLEKKIPVTLQMDIDNRFYDADLNAFNIVARAAGHRQGRRGRDARRALRLVAHRHRRDRQRRRVGGDDGGDADPEDHAA